MSFPSVRILLVEDHPDTAKVLVRLLRASGHDVIHAGGCADALELAERAMRAGGLDLLISDVGLPDGSGLEVMRELSSRHGLRGIALSGFGMHSDHEESTAAGFCRHLTKPVSMATLRTAIADATQAS